jgi:hypothetical protein
MRRLSKNVQRELLEEMRQSFKHFAAAYDILWGRQGVSKEMQMIAASFASNPKPTKRPRK